MRNDHVDSVLLILDDASHRGWVRSIELARMIDGLIAFCILHWPVGRNVPYDSQAVVFSSRMQARAPKKSSDHSIGSCHGTKPKTKLT